MRQLYPFENLETPRHKVGVMADGGGEPEAATAPSGQTENIELSGAVGGVGSVSKGPDYAHLIEYGVDIRVANKLHEIYQTGKLSHSDLDERALDALKEFPVDGALAVLNQFLESNLAHVSNKSAFLCGVMKTYRQKSRGALPALEARPLGKGPDEEKIRAILERTGYTLDVTTGQRKYGGPPANWTGPPPPNGCEVFCGKIPRDMYEDELIPLFEKCGVIWDLRLMMDPLSGLNRGYAFVTFTNPEGAYEAVRQLNDYEISKGKKLGVTISYNNHRLFVGNIPKTRDRHELFEDFSKHAPGLMEVIIYSSPDDRRKNRGFCFLEYESHKAASLAKRRLGTGRVKVWGCDIIVDWADPQEEPDEETMSKVKVLYVRNLTADCTEERLKEAFEAHGRVQRVKKIKDYAFVHFEERDDAVTAMATLNGRVIHGSAWEVSLAKPPSDKKKKEEILRARERRMMQLMSQRGGLMPLLPIRGGAGGSSGGGRGGVRQPFGRGDYDYEYEAYGYGTYRGGYSDPYYNNGYYAYDDYYYNAGGGGGGSGVTGGRGRAGRPAITGTRGDRQAGARGARGSAGAASTGVAAGAWRGAPRGGQWKGGAPAPRGSRATAMGSRHAGMGGGRDGSPDENDPQLYEGRRSTTGGGERGTRGETSSTSALLSQSGSGASNREGLSHWSPTEVSGTTAGAVTQPSSATSSSATVSETVWYQDSYGPAWN